MCPILASSSKVAAQGTFYNPGGGGCSALNKHKNLSLPRMSLHARKRGNKVVCKQTNQLPCVPGKINCGSHERHSAAGVDTLALPTVGRHSKTQ